MKEEEFIGFIGKLPKAALADLRRFSQPHKAIPHLEGRLHPLHPKRKEIYYLLARIMATTGFEYISQKGNLGNHVASLWQKDQSPSLEKRFLILVDADEHQLPSRLLAMLSLLGSKGVAINYPQLLKDLQFFHHPSGLTKKLWLQSFYQQASGNPQTPQETQDALDTQQDQKE